MSYSTLLGSNDDTVTIVTCSPAGETAGANNRDVERFDSMVETGQIIDPHEEQHFANGGPGAGDEGMPPLDAESDDETPSRAGGRARGGRTPKSATQEGKDLQALREYLFSDDMKTSAFAPFGSRATENKYLSWMTDYYAWHRKTRGEPTADQRNGKHVLNNALAAAFPGGQQAMPSALAVAPDVTLDSINSFRQYMFFDPIAEGSTMTRRKLVKVMECQKLINRYNQWQPEGKERCAMLEYYLPAVNSDTSL